MKNYLLSGAVEKEGFLEKIIENANDIIYTTDRRKRFTFINHKIEEYGYNRKNLLGKSFLTFLAKKHKGRRSGETLRRGGEKVYDIDFKDAKGKLRHGILSTSPVKDENKRIFGVLGVITDITDRRRAEEELRHNAKIIGTTSEAIVGADSQGRINFWNKGAEKMFGFRGKEMVGKPITPIMPSHKHYTESRRMVRKVKNEGMVIHYETQRKRKDGGILDVVLSLMRLEDDEGNVIGTAAIITDITQRKLAEDTLKQRAVQLALLNKIGGQIASELELEKVLERATYLIRKSFGYHHVAIYLIDHPQKELELRAKASKYSALFSPGHRVSIDRGIVGWVAKKGKARLSNDVSKDKYYRNLFPNKKLTRSELCVPIQVGNGVVGVLNVESPIPNAFDENDVLVMETLANEIAVAIDNARLYEEVQEELLERKRAEKALRKSEEEFRLTFENAKDAIFWADPRSGLVINCNRAAEDLLEKKRKNIIGRPQTLLHPSKKAKFYGQLFRKHIRRKGAVDDEAEVITKTGKIKPVHITASVTLVGGKPIIQGIFRDITERKRAEKALRESEERYSTLVEEGHDGIVIIQDGLFRFVNKKFARMIGYKKKELVGKKFESILAHDQRKEVLRRYKKRISGKKVPRIYEAKLLTKKREEFPIELNAGTIVYDNKLSDLVFIRNISKRKKAEEALRESEEHYRALVEASPDAIFVFNPGGKLIYASPSCKAVTGYAPKDFLKSKNILERWIFPEDYENLMHTFQKSLKGKAERNFEFRAKKKGESDIWVSSSWEPIYGASEDLVGVLVIQRDITDRKMAEELCMLQIEELKKIDKMKDEFLSIASHELKTPLIPIEGYLELLAEGRFGHLTKKQIQIIEKIRGKEAQLKLLINDLLDLNKLQSGKMVFDMKGADINSLIKETITEQKFIAQEKDIKIIVKEKMSLPTVRGDRMRLGQVLSNLISNAIKFSAAGAEVIVKAKKEDSVILISVSDQGIGIPPENLENIFDVFYQVDSSTSRKYPGTGLGLSICKKIIEHHGGRIWVDSKLGGGSTFYFTLLI
ncbi:PAS domain S-box protein [Candidatus Altiarchaeota archaeon]